MDESPLALFGDQGRRSVNDTGTPNNVDGNISDKRFATLILTVFADDNSRVGPILIFKGEGRVSSAEISQYAQGVTVFCYAKRRHQWLDDESIHSTLVVQGMNEVTNMTWNKNLSCIFQVKDAYPKLFIADSGTSHLSTDVLRDLREKRVVIAVVREGCTMYVQVLDVSIFSVFKKHYDDVVEEYFDKNGPRSRVKLSASQSRILCTRLTWSSWLRTLKSVNFLEAFQDIGYVWTDDSPVSLRSIPGYSFDPKSIGCLSVSDDGSDVEDRIDLAAEEAVKQRRVQMMAVQTEQLKLIDVLNRG